ncbi:alanine racemase [Cohnella sp. JJ-181]|uniref:alanine racemase n=1 Tax=Cohnella rhizoplanae TaxID=2974897 RepID=UPI0022FF5241|nr:alanine racemase [Cohnella sp. JJ-181]CAI6083489.1 Alanine racemase [Cohnella sp. JJ-181]
MLRETWAEIDPGRIVDNLRAIRGTLPAGVKLMAVVKANGYGHGDLEAAEAARQAGADYLAVAFLEEALRLRAGGVTLPILILTPIRPDQAELAASQELTLTVTDAAWFRELRKGRPAPAPGGRKLRVHVKADTGLGRIGFRTEAEWDALVPWLAAPDIDVDGFYTHFATAGQADTAYLERQACRFAELMERCKASGIAVRHYHCAGSAAALRFPGLALDMVRIGAAMYGYYPPQLTPPVQLKPALSLHSTLMQVKRVRRGEYLGYDNAYRSDADEWIGTVPIGYADGWSQRMRGADVLVRGRRAQVVGKISMDQLMIRLPGPCAPGDRVTLIGRQGGERITFAELAVHIDGAAQEISTALTDRVHRICANEKEVQCPWSSPYFQPHRREATVI